jgi:leucyl-tRNA synthetase
VFRLLDKHAEHLRGVRAAGTGMDLAAASEKEKALLRKAHQTLRRVTNDLEVRWHFNSSIALLMELVNELHAAEPLTQDARPAVVKEVMQMLVLMMAPYTPHLAEELWEMLGNAGGLSKVRWPAYQEELAREDLHEVVIQVNGKVRSRIFVESGLGEAELVSRAIADAKAAPFVNGKRIVKRIVVPDKLVNIVVAG